MYGVRTRLVGGLLAIIGVAAVSTPVIPAEAASKQLQTSCNYGGSPIKYLRVHGIKAQLSVGIFITTYSNHRRVITGVSDLWITGSTTGRTHTAAGKIYTMTPTTGWFAPSSFRVKALAPNGHRQFYPLVGDNFRLPNRDYGQKVRAVLMYHGSIYTSKWYHVVNRREGCISV